MHTLLHVSLAQAGGSEGGSTLGLLVPLVLMGVLFYFLLIRPQQRRARAQRDLISSVEVGDEIMTAGGILGTVTAMDDEDEMLTVEIAPGTRIRVVKRAVSQRFVEEDEPGGELDDEPDGELGDGTADAADEVGDDTQR
jgi:preprotein translocase subunit YajC